MAFLKSHINRVIRGFCYFCHINQQQSLSIWMKYNHTGAWYQWVTRHTIPSSTNKLNDTVKQALHRSTGDTMMLTYWKHVSVRYWDDLILPTTNLEGTITSSYTPQHILRLQNLMRDKCFFPIAIQNQRSLHKVLQRWFAFGGKAATRKGFHDVACHNLKQLWSLQNNWDHYRFFSLKALNHLDTMMNLPSYKS